jgi:hypothetical protein
MYLENKADLKAKLLRMLTVDAFQYIKLLYEHLFCMCREK